MKTYAFKVLQPEFGHRDLFLVCAANHTEATSLLGKRLDDPGRQIEDSRELQDGLAQFVGMKPGDVLVWAPFPS